jgi:hypothetical protein
MVRLRSNFLFYCFAVLPDFWNFPLWSVALATISPLISSHLISITVTSHDLLLSNV